MSTAITTYDKKWAEEAQRYADKEKTEGSFISLSGGILKLGDDELPGNQMCVIILHSVFENTFYATKYDPDKPYPPICYAMAEDDDELAPHPSMAKALEYFEPQAEECATCEHNEWNSAEQGRGKACQNRRRLALAFAGIYTRVRGTQGEYALEIFEDDEHYQDAEIHRFKLPVTSGREFSKYVKHVSNEFQRPPYGVVTRIYVVPDAKYQHIVKFETLAELPDEMFPVISPRHEEAVKSIITPYSPPDEDSDGKSKARNRIAGLRK